MNGNGSRATFFYDAPGKKTCATIKKPVRWKPQIKVFLYAYSLSITKYWKNWMETWLL